MSAPNNRKIKILMLHGYTQSGPLFHSKTRAVEKHLKRYFPSLELVYPTGPIKLQPADIPGFSSSSSSSSASRSSSTATTTADDNETSFPTNETETLEAYAWWRRDARTGAYNHLDESIAYLAEVLSTQGPFDGVIGFSQGAAAAAMVASLLEPGRREAFARQKQKQKHEHGEGGMDFPASFLVVAENGEERLIHPPLKFAVVYSGFVARLPRCRAFYDPPLVTPVLHFIGSLDTIVDEGRSLDLVRACEAGEDSGTGRLVYHPGGHFLPAQKPYLNCLVGFLKDILVDGDGRADEEEEEEEGRERRRDSRI